MAINKMKIVFLGYAVNVKEAEGLSGVSIAGNKMQINVLYELSKYQDLNLDILTIYPVALWPKDKKNLFVKEKKIKLFDDTFAQRISFLNLPLIKQIWQTLSLFIAALKVVDKDTFVFTFNMFPQVGLPASWLKKIKKCKVCSLLADLPIDDNTVNKSLIRKFFRYVFDFFTKRAIKKCDKLIVLNKYAAMKFAPGIPYLVVEGGVAGELIKPLQSVEHRQKVIVYSGALTEYSGILPMIDAMNSVDDPEISLEIYGDGVLKEEVIKHVNKCKNVKYMGRVSNKEMLEIQKHAWLLVNPRLVNDPISQVTFPSKLFEYMLSGTPVLTTKLNGLTEDLIENTFWIEKDEKEMMKKKINEISLLTKEQLLKIGENNYKFIINTKKWNLQVNRIINFLFI